MKEHFRNIWKKKNIEVQIAIVQGRFNHRTVADR